MIKDIISRRKSQKKYVETHRDKVRKYARKYRDKNRKYLRKKWIEYAKTRRTIHKEDIKRYENSPKRLVGKLRRRNIFYGKIELLKNELGGKCVQCGFNDIRVLHFHHLRDKEFEVCSNLKIPIEKLREESKKCILLCANCHFLHHLNNRKNI
jgi:hypothetical protein